MLKPRAVPVPQPASASIRPRPAIAATHEGGAPDRCALPCPPPRSRKPDAGLARCSGGVACRAAARRTGVAAPGRSCYRLRGDPPAIIGRSVQSWELRDNSYRITSVMETVGLGALLRPTRMESVEPRAHRRYRAGAGELRFRATGKGRAERIDRVGFDWAAASRASVRAPSAPLPAGAQDLLRSISSLAGCRKTGGWRSPRSKKLGRYRLELVSEELLETRSASCGRCISCARRNDDGSLAGCRPAPAAG